jgi:cytochrome c
MNPVLSSRRPARLAAWAAAALCLTGASEAYAAGDAARGAQVFKATCGVCHLARGDANRNDALTKIGPNLFGVIGRRAGTLKGFRYSEAMKASGVTWTDDALRRYIAAPQKTIPNVRMSFAGLPRPKDAEDVLAYLHTLK